jgi:hypothetical protein
LQCGTGLAAGVAAVIRTSGAVNVRIASHADWASADTAMATSSADAAATANKGRTRQ